MHHATKGSHRVLASGWAVVGAATWIATLLAVTAIAISSRTISRPPWWLGPTTDPAPFFALAILAIVVILTTLAYLGSYSTAPWIGIFSSLFLGSYAIADLDATIGIAIAQIIVAAAALTGSLATFAGLHWVAPE
ncbi:MAG: hypothetical protein EXQ63_08770 [Ilumatobacteraceae bacterium]|nr:hypothetical protein [Ilumatobacteraceae bacterium]